jgi:hypothetical protein
MHRNEEEPDVNAHAVNLTANFARQRVSSIAGVAVRVIKEGGQSRSIARYASQHRAGGDESKIEEKANKVCKGTVKCVETRPTLSV